MIESNDFRRLKTFAKRYARANKIAQHQALDLVAGQVGFPNWVKLVAASKKGWQLGPEQSAAVENFVLPLVTAVFRQGDHKAMSGRFAHAEDADTGMIGEHTYRIHDFLHDVVMSGGGWSIRVPENPAATLIVETYTADGQPCPVLEPSF